ncbi:DNA-processing protein DprA [Mesorhizobium dulcispinae]|uniref:DNA-processing protein DprA n=1 Tax=Mesorhizobium dulcispinae TaxID=3072316 RepID=UPI002A2423F2|nr:DNA-processing protein DprA [Mesorhizobium sp. VK23D]MDX8522226.1 DNA-processing protein DprA [Mesorhizobium sp. VK23D]
MTTTSLSLDGQATALLVGRFGEGRAKPLTRVEFNRVAQNLHQRGLRPSDLFRQLPDDLPVDRERLSLLISRGTALALAVESWSQVGIRLVSRADPNYPARFRRLLKSGSSPILYYAGDLSLLERPTISVVGSRDATQEGLRFAHVIGERAAAEGVVTVSGDARGVDRAAMEGGLDHGGYAVGILSDSLFKSVLSKRYRQAIGSGNLLLISHVEPDARFTVTQAMERNRYIYAAGDVVIVADSDIKGGTWSGAIENLKHRWAPAFVRTGHETREGNVALLNAGLVEISDGWLSHERPIHSLLDVRIDAPESLPLFSTREQATADDSSRDILFNLFRERLLSVLDAPQDTSNIADSFGLEIHQAEVWLKRAAAAGVVEITANRRWKRKQGH